MLFHCMALTPANPKQPEGPIWTESDSTAVASK